MEKFEACIFDLDGVIVDTAKYHYLAWKRLANELGFNFSEEDNERLKGVSRMKSLEILLKIGNIKFDEEFILELAEKKNRWYREYIVKMDESEILKGALEFLESLKADGIKLALGSASKNAMTILKQIEIVSLFDAIIDGNKVSKAKPDPEVFLMGAKELEVSPEKCIVFEDAKAGIEAAKRANMYVVGIGFSDVLKGADKVISGLHEITIEDLNLL